MSLFQVFRVALRALYRNKTRSLLTILGVIIGVAAVISMVAIGEGAKRKVQETFASMGADLLIVMPGTTTRGGAFGGFGTMPTLTWNDLEAIRREVPSVRTAAALLRSPAQVISEDQNWTTIVNGTSPDYFDIRDWSIKAGMIFDASDVDAGAKVAVLGQTVVSRLFGAIDPIGETIRIKKVPFRVIGVLAAKGQSPTGQDFDDVVIIPETTYFAKIEGGLQNFVQGVFFVRAHAGATQRAANQITAVLRERHNIRPGSDDDFSIRNLAEMAGAQEAGMKTFTTLLASIAAVSLLVGGIGIMNIMLVSVTERTREIGIRMAVGARPIDVLAQFLVEALTLSATGGLIGIVVGLVGAEQLATAFGWPMIIQGEIVLLSFGFSVLVGVIFGLYPAQKASKLDPLDALRFE